MYARRITRLALLSTLALILFVVEDAILFVGIIPGMKIGLANIVTLFVLLRYRRSDAALVLFVRVFLAAVFGGQMMSLFYSTAGAVLALLAMSLFLYVLGSQYICLVSIAGALAHNCGQIIVAWAVMGMNGIAVYIPYLFLCAIITGFFNGLVCHFMNRYIPKEI